MNKLLTLTCAAAAMVASATDLPWTGSETSLGGGKVTLTYDGNNKVTSLVAKPTGGEEFRITGNAMTFAEGAAITFAAPSEGAVAGGSLVFANDVTADGALNMTRTDGAYVVWEAATSAERLSETYQTIVPDGVSSVGDWELVMSYVLGAGSDLNYQNSSASGRGPYLPINNTSVGQGSDTEYRFYVLNRFRAQNAYTWSQRIQLGRRKTGADSAKLMARCTTVVHSPGYVCLPYTDLWTAWHNDMPQDSGLFCTTDTYSNDVKNKATGKPTHGGSTANCGIDRLIVRRTGSAAMVGFAGEATLNGTVDISLGVKMSVLPKVNSTFTAPVFSGQGDVEYQRNATLANMNYMTYATDLTVTNGALVIVSGANAFPTNALVNIRKDGIMRLTAKVANNGTGISDGFAFLNVLPGGELQVSKENAGKIANGRQEILVDGGTYWFGWDYPGGDQDRINCYTPYIVLLNGAQVKGSFLKWGNNQSQRWYVGDDAGSSADPVVIDSIIHYSYSGQAFTLVVNDITGNDDADLVVNRKVARAGTDVYGSSANNWNIPFYKYGDGTVRFDDKVVLRGTLSLFGGKVIFGDNGETYPATGEGHTSVQSKDRDVNLRPGTAIGKTANALELGTLQLTGDGVHTLELGPTATITFANSSGKPWAGKLIVKGFHDGAVRFGDSAAALTAAQQKMIYAESADGKRSRLHLTSDGYLVPPGMMISIR